MHDVKESCMQKDPFKMQDRPVDFNITGKEVSLI